MDAALVPRSVFNRTKECTDITKEESLAAGKPLTDLRKEMATAIRNRELESARDMAAKRLDALGPRPASADPQAEAVASAAGISVSQATWIPIAVIGFAIELAASFGMYVLGHRPTAGKEPADRPAELSGDELATIRAGFFAPDVRRRCPRTSSSPAGDRRGFFVRGGMQPVATGCNGTPLFSTNARNRF